MNQLNVLAAALATLIASCQTAPGHPTSRGATVPVAPEGRSAPQDIAPQQAGRVSGGSRSDIQLSSGTCFPVWLNAVSISCGSDPEVLKSWLASPSGEVPFTLLDEQSQVIPFGTSAASGISASFSPGAVRLTLTSKTGGQQTLSFRKSTSPATVLGLPVIPSKQPDLLKTGPQEFRTIAGISSVFTEFDNQEPVAAHSIRERFHLVVPDSTIARLQALGPITVRRSTSGEVAILFSYQGKQLAAFARTESEPVGSATSALNAARAVVAHRIDILDLADSAACKAAGLNSDPTTWPLIDSSLKDL